jgi:hypothetical protein
LVPRQGQAGSTNLVRVHKLDAFLNHNIPQQAESPKDGGKCVAPEEGEAWGVVHLRNPQHPATNSWAVKV